MSHKPPAEPTPSTSRTDPDRVAAVPEEPIVAPKKQRLLKDASAVCLILKGMLGYGIFTMPYGLMQTNIYVGCFLTLLLGAAFTYSMYSLVDCAQLLKKRHALDATDYADVAKFAFKHGPNKFRKLNKPIAMVVNVCLALNMLLCCLIYLSYVNANLGRLPYFFEKSLSDDPETNAILYGLIFTVLLAVITFVKELRLHTVLAAFAIMGILQAVNWVIVFMGRQEVPVWKQKHIGAAPSQSIAVLVGLTTWSLQSVAVVLPVSGAMAEPKRLIENPFLLPIGMAIGCVLTLYMGAFAAIRGGLNTPVNIIDLAPINDIYGWPAHLCAVVGMFFSFLLPFHLLFKMFFVLVEPRIKGKKNLVEHGLRFVLVFILFGVSYGIRTLSPVLLICLIGGICLSVLGLILPAAIELAVYSPEPGYGKNKWRQHKNIAFMALGGIMLLLCVLGAFA